jgi:hypothetical protein
LNKKEAVETIKANDFRIKVDAQVKIYKMRPRFKGDELETTSVTRNDTGFTEWLHIHKMYS